MSGEELSPPQAFLSRLHSLHSSAVTLTVSLCLAHTVAF